MKITKVTSHILQYDMPEELGYSQRYYNKRSAHLVEVETDSGITGWGECFGTGNLALGNKGIVELVIQPMILGIDANHCYTTSDAFYVDRALAELDAYWFEEPVAHEDHDGYRELRHALRVNISGGDAAVAWRSLPARSDARV